MINKKVCNSTKFDMNQIETETESKLRHFLKVRVRFLCFYFNFVCILF